MNTETEREDTLCRTADRELADRNDQPNIPSNDENATRWGIDLGRFGNPALRGL
jgi:hypothetical protein